MIGQFFDSLEKTVPILLAIFVTVFCLIVLARIIFAFLLNQAYARYQALKKTSKNLFSSQKKKNFSKKDEELFRKKIPRAHSEVKAEMQARGNAKESGTYEMIPSQQQEMDRQEMNQINIVDIVKPIGFWTSMILGQKLTYLIQSAQVLNKRGDKGFWASMIEAKEREAGRQHSRGR